MNIQNLRMMAIFAKVVEVGSFKQAAEQLDMVPSVVSKQISDLEAELGIQLLYRSTRALRLSDAGQVFLKACNRMLEEAEAGFSDLVIHREQLQGHLRVTVPSALQSGALAAFLMRFQQRHPGIRLEVECNDESRDLIKDQFDLGLHIGELPDSQLFAHLLFKTRGILCVHRAHSMLLDRVNDPGDLQHWQGLLLPGMARGITLSHHDASRPEQVVKPANILCLNTGQLIRSCLEHGPVWGVFPDFAVQADLNAGTLLRLLPDWYVAADALYAVSAAPLSRLPLAKAFVDALKVDLLDSLVQKTQT